MADADAPGQLGGKVAVRQGFGHIVNTSSAAGLLPHPLNSPYCTAKHAIVGLSLSLRLEGADLGVNQLAWRLSCLFPRLMDRTAAREVRKARQHRSAGGQR